MRKKGNTMSKISQLTFNFEKKYEVVMHQINIQKMGEFKQKMSNLQSEMDDWFKQMDKEIEKGNN